MLCSGVSLDEDPYDYVIRKSAEMEMTVQPSGMGSIITPDDELDANLLLFANSLSFGDIPGNAHVVEEIFICMTTSVFLYYSMYLLALCLSLHIIINS